MKQKKLVQPELYAIGKVFWVSLTQRLLEWTLAPSAELGGWFGNQGLELAQVPGLCLGADKIKREAWQLSLATIKWATKEQVLCMQLAARTHKHLWQAEAKQGDRRSCEQWLDKALDGTGATAHRIAKNSLKGPAVDDQRHLKQMEHEQQYWMLP